MTRHSINFRAIKKNGVTALQASGTRMGLLRHLDGLDNKIPIICVGVSRAEEEATALYMEGDIFDGENHANLPRLLMNDILDGHKVDTRWNFFPLVSYLGEDIDVAVGGRLFAFHPNMQKFAKDLAAAVFGKGGRVHGTQLPTSSLVLITPDLINHTSNPVRQALAWNYKTGEQAFLPVAYGRQATRHSVAGDTLLCALQNTGSISVFTGEQMQQLLDGDSSQTWVRLLDDLDGFVIEELSLGMPKNDGSYSIIASGQWRAEEAICELTLTVIGGRMRLLASEPTLKDDTTASLGAPVRIDSRAATFIDAASKSNTVTRIPLTALPSPMSAFLARAASSQPSVW